MNLWQDSKQAQGRARPAGAGGSQKVIYAALAADIVIAASKFLAAIVTGSTASMVEGIHSTVDSGNQLLLLVGTKRSNRPPDEWHPFGYGKVLYFWAFIVALSIFSLGGGISIYHGLQALQNPPALQDPTWSYVALLFAAPFEGYSWNIARKGINRLRRPGESLWQALRSSSDPSTYTVFVEDSAALAGIAVALTGIWLGQFFGSPYFDPAASVIIGAILVGAAFVLASETGGLLVGESIDHEQIIELKKILSGDQAIEKVGHLLTMQLGPDNVLLTANVKFRRGLSIEDVEQAIERVDRAIRTRYPMIRLIYYDSESIKSTVRA